MQPRRGSLRLSIADIVPNWDAIDLLAQRERERAARAERRRLRSCRRDPLVSDWTLRNARERIDG